MVRNIFYNSKTAKIDVGRRGVGGRLGSVRAPKGRGPRLISQILETFMGVLWYKYTVFIVFIIPINY